MAKKHSTAVYIGRFQSPGPHKAHLESISVGLDIADRLIIFVGSAKRPRDSRNPWSYDERVTVLQLALREWFGEELRPKWSDYPPESILSRITFVPLRDYRYNDYQWISDVVSSAMRHGAENNTHTVLVGSRKDWTSYYIDMFPQWSKKILPVMKERGSAISATDVRYTLFKDGHIDDVDTVMESTKTWAKSWFNTTSRSKYVLDNYKFHLKHDAQYAHLEHTPHFITTDAVVVRSGCVLLIKRKYHPGKDLYAFPGGYKKEGMRIAASMLTELKEEAGLMVPKDELMKSIKDVKVFDDPGRSLRGEVVTHAHLIDLGIGELPTLKNGIENFDGDDAYGAQWIPIYDALQLEEEMFEDHYDILVNMAPRDNYRLF